MLSVGLHSCETALRCSSRVWWEWKNSGLAAVAGEDPAGDSIKEQSFDDQLIELTREDDFARNVLERIASGHSEYGAAEGRRYHAGKIYVPEALRDVIMERYHDSPFRGKSYSFP